MSDQTLDTIGKKLKGGERRDAVHFAVAPVLVTGGMLRAGERAKLVAGRNDAVVGWDCGDGPPDGVIDPFLENGYVLAGERCWLFLYPNTITGLRHEWTHPAFPEAFPDQTPASAQRPDESSREYSELWLRAYAEKYRGDYERMIAGVESGEGAFFGDDLEYGDFRPGSEFWRHVSVVTGKEFSETHINNTRFRCAC